MHFPAVPEALGGSVQGKPDSRWRAGKGGERENISLPKGAGGAQCCGSGSGHGGSRQLVGQLLQRDVNSPVVGHSEPEALTHLTQPSVPLREVLTPACLSFPLSTHSVQPHAESPEEV